MMARGGRSLLARVNKVTTIWGSVSKLQDFQNLVGMSQEAPSVNGSVPVLTVGKAVCLYSWQIARSVQDSV